MQKENKSSSKGNFGKVAFYILWFKKNKVKIR